MQALFGEVDAAQIARAMTAIVAAGLAARAQARSGRSLPRATGVQAGLRWTLPSVASGTLAIGGFGSLGLFAFDTAAGASSTRELRLTLRITDRIGWLAASPELELRAMTLELGLPRGPAQGAEAGGSARLVLHDARVFGQSWEALVLGNAAGIGARPRRR